MSETKTCRRCGVEKPLSCFPSWTASKTRERKTSSWCRPCKRQYKSEWQKKHRDKSNRYKAKNYKKQLSSPEGMAHKAKVEANKKARENEKLLRIELKENLRLLRAVIADLKKKEQARLKLERPKVARKVKVRDMLKCRKCKLFKPRAMFQKHPSRMGVVCSDCYLTPEEARNKRFEKKRQQKKVLEDQGLRECTTCGEIKSIGDFPGKNKKTYCCKVCLSVRSVAVYRSKTPEQRREYSRKCWNNMMKNPDTKLKYALRRRQSSALKRAMEAKTESSSKIVNYIGCSVEQLRLHIEKQFTNDMTWKNHSLYGWHIDHIVPLCRFDLTKESDLKLAWHYSNLRPLSAKENRQKLGKIPKNHQPELPLSIRNIKQTSVTCCTSTGPS